MKGDNGDLSRFAVLLEAIEILLSMHQNAEKEPMAIDDNDDDDNNDDDDQLLILDEKTNSYISPSKRRNPPPAKKSTSRVDLEKSGGILVSELAPFLQGAEKDFHYRDAEEWVLDAERVGILKVTRVLVGGMRVRLV
jgi:hypothetical protein